jgi:predicted transcriptional regulator
MKTVRVELDDETYARLQREAQRRGVDAEAAARSALCEQLAEE